MPTVGQDVSGDSALQTAIAALKAKIEGAEESSDIAQLLSDINIALAGKQNTLTFDSAPSSGSSNPVTSGGVKTALDGKQNTLTFDSAPTSGSSNPVTSGGVKTALDGKQDTLIFDSEPTNDSTKPVTSGGVKEALDDMYSEISDRGGAIFGSASGSLVTITDGADDLPMKSCVVNIEPIQEGEGDPSPENVRAISGRTGLTVSHSGADTSDPATISVNWQTKAGDVYGGSLDVVSGKLTVDHALVDLSTLNWTLTESWGTAESPIFSSRSLRYLAVWDTGGNTPPDLLCSRYTTYSRTYLNQNNAAGICYANTATNPDIVIRDSNYSDIESFVASLSGITAVYKMKEPIVYQLTPQEVHTLLGENNVWSDGGDISVEYPVDTKTYVDAFSIKTVEVSGQTPTIVAEENTRYICGEVTSLDFTPCASGICDIRFTAASISTVLTMPSTVKLPDWFDPTSLEANVTYEINIVDGVYGAVMSWA